MAITLLETNKVKDNLTLSCSLAPISVSLRVFIVSSLGLYKAKLGRTKLDVYVAYHIAHEVKDIH